MTYIIDFTVSELKNHKKFKTNHTERQAEATYKLLLDKDFRGPMLSYLLNHKIVVEIYEPALASMGWASLTESPKVIIKLR